MTHLKIASSTMIRTEYPGFSPHSLDSEHEFWVGRLPDDLRIGPEQFAALWATHPEEHHTIVMHGRPVPTPRWQQAFGADYHFAGTLSKALPTPGHLAPLRNWAQHAVDARLNGLLVNWYDGREGHYIGKHRDNTKNMIVDTPIVTVSYGEERVFRVRAWRGTALQDFLATDGTVFIIPFATNLCWTHEVPAFARYRGRRVSVTIRAFQG